MIWKYDCLEQAIMEYYLYFSLPLNDAAWLKTGMLDGHVQ